MSDLLKHVLISEVIGESIYHAQSRKKLHAVNTMAFSLGLTSHMIMDLVDHEFVVNWFNYVQLKPAVFYISFQIIFSVLILRHIFTHDWQNKIKLKIKLLAIAGGVFPDIIDGIYSIYNPSAWYNGNLLFFWHRSQGVEYIMSMGATIAVSFSLYFFRFYVIPSVIGLKSADSKIQKKLLLKARKIIGLTKELRLARLFFWRF